MGNRDNKPLVSVIMATYNEPKDFITKSINSILHQDYKNIELLIADDSTNKDTVAAIDALASKDERIRVLRKKKRMGFVSALDYAMECSRGELLARMDGDDMALPDRISKQVKFAFEHPDIDVFGGSMNIIDENDRIVSERHYPTTPSSIKLMFLFRSPFAHPTVMFRRKVIENGFFYNPEYRKAEDIDFFMRLYKNGYKFGNLNDKLLNYRVAGDLQNKRSKVQWRYNHKARKLFIKDKPLFSLISYLVSFIYEYIPNRIISLYYKRENTKRKH